jgi:hypothetical protein
MFNQDDRTCTAFGQAYLLQERGARGVLTCAKAKNVMSIKSQQEIDPSVTKCALSIEDYDCLTGSRHVLILTRKPFTLRVASRSWHAYGYRRYLDDDRGALGHSADGTLIAGVHFVVSVFCKCLRNLVDLVRFELPTSSMPWKRRRTVCERLL